VLQNREIPMLKVEIVLVCLLALLLGGCTENTPEPAKPRTGSVGGVTTQDVDDLAKPDSKPK
jgi:hypothetical protein